DPTVGVRGIHHRIVASLGGQPLTHHATLAPQAADALAAEHAERGRTPVAVVEEAHLLGHDQLEALRLLTLSRAGDYPEHGWLRACDRRRRRWIRPNDSA